MKIIKDIKPFNDFFYKDCYYNSLFSIVHYFQCDIIDFFINEFIMYTRSHNSILEGIVTYYDILTLKKILKKNNIIVYEGYKHEKIVDEVIKSIDKGMPIIIRVDCYNESIRKELYHKEHLDHSLLIYGYDSTKKNLCVIEHTGKNNLNYSYRSISYDDMIEANKGYLEYYGYLGEPLYMQFNKITNIENNNDTNRNKITRFNEYTINFLSCKKEVMDSLESLYVINNNIINSLRNTDFLIRHLDEILQLVNDIINAKKIEKYRSTYFFTNKKILNSIDIILSDWLFVRLSILNFIYSGNCINDKFNVAISKLKSSYEKEKKLTELIYNELKVCGR